MFPNKGRNRGLGTKSVIPGRMTSGGETTHRRAEDIIGQEFPDLQRPPSPPLNLRLGRIIGPPKGNPLCRQFRVVSVPGKPVDGILFSAPRERAVVAQPPVLSYFWHLRVRGV